ncbi:hypothetical protein [Fredinandcohnia sp. 179-A 10B2 NHS]|uniref:hypothetical protein n=1 Tax=Fredinandcohnia sp. 179-A 10B2 NHS TaxID=3235176 RepID=UPI0039A0DEAB
MQVSRIDENGFYIEPEILKPNENGQYEIPSDCIEVRVPEGLYRPKWNGIQWLEGLTLEEIQAFRQEHPPLEEPLKKENEMNALAIMELAEIVLGG